MKTPSDLETILRQAPQPKAPAELAAVLEDQIRLPASGTLPRQRWFSWRRLWIPLAAAGGAAALGAILSPSWLPGSGPAAPGASPASDHVEASLVSASEDRAGTWGKFAPGLGDDNGNGVAIANDWEWKATLRLTRSNSIATILVEHEDSNQIWTSRDPIHWPLVVFEHDRQLNHAYGETMGPLAPGVHEFDLFGQVDNRQLSGTRLRIEFTDGTSVSAVIPKTNITVGLAGTTKPPATANPAPVIYGSLTAASPARLMVSGYPEPVITSLGVAGSGQMAITATGMPGQAYALEATATMTPPFQWQPIATNTAGPAGDFSFSDARTNLPAAGLYRLRAVEAPARAESPVVPPSSDDHRL